MTENTRSIEDCKAASLAAENLNVKTRFEFDVVYAGATYQADPASYSEILAAIAQTQLPDNFYWVDKNNNKVSMTKTNLQELALLVQTERFRIFDAHQNRKAQIRNATEISQLFE